MRNLVIAAVFLTSFTVSAVAAEPSATSPVKGAICYSNNLVVPGEQSVVISCKGIGRFGSVVEMYEKGFRVVSSGFLPESRPGMPPLTSTMYLIVEQRPL